MTRRRTREPNDARVARHSDRRADRRRLPCVHRDPKGLEGEVRARQGDRDCSRSIAFSSPRCTTRRTTDFSRGRTATTAIRSTCSCSAKSPSSPMCMMRARAIGLMQMRDDKGVRRQNHRRAHVDDPQFAEYTHIREVPKHVAARAPPLLSRLQNARRKTRRSRRVRRARRSERDDPRGDRGVQEASTPLLI